MYNKQLRKLPGLEKSRRIASDDRHFLCLRGQLLTALRGSTNRFQHHCILIPSQEVINTGLRPEIKIKNGETESEETAETISINFMHGPPFKWEGPTTMLIFFEAACIARKHLSYRKYHRSRAPV